MARIEFDHVTVRLPGTGKHGVIALSDVSFVIPDGEFVAIIGPSGSGKSTLIRTVAGLTDVVSGRVLLDDVDVTDVPTARRDIGMVFQAPVLFRHRNVRRNVSFPLEIRRRSIDEIDQRVQAEVRALHFEHLLQRKPSELSRGETQLVQIARALVRTPSVLLLDEPLAGLDPTLQSRTRTELVMLQRGYEVTTVMTTNDPTDVATMPSRLIALEAGRVAQIGTPADVRRQPATMDAALSTGECWMLPARVVRASDGYWLSGIARDGGVAFQHRAWAAILSDWIDREVVLGVRPDDVRMSANGSIEAVVVKVLGGPLRQAICDIGGRHIMIGPSGGLEDGDIIRLTVDHVVVFDPLTGRAIC